MKSVDTTDEESEKYRGFRITEIHAICAVDPDDDSEGIVGYLTPIGPMPMIASDPVRLAALKQMAQQIADQDRRNFKVVKFSVREDIGEIKSRTTS